MTRKFILWSLNQSSQMIEDNWQDIASLFGNDNIELGNNASFYTPDTIQAVNSTHVYPKHRLMLETDGYVTGTLNLEEYFAPICLKTIGLDSYLPDGLMDGSDSGRLSAIRSSNYPFRSVDDTGLASQFWKTPLAVSPIQKMQMKTAYGFGYYRLLHQYLNRTENTGKKHILIGYSQGGLVARYLNYLDQAVYKKHHIAGVITIGSPNWGSPLANPYNSNNVSTILFSILNKYAHNPGLFSDVIRALITNLIPAFPTIGNIATLVDYLDSTIADCLTKPPSPNIDTLITMRKWLSGMYPVPKGWRTAFSDLSMLNYDNPESVLSLVNDTPSYHSQSKTGYYGAVVNTNNQVNDLLKAMIPGFPVIPQLPILADISDMYQGVMKEMESSKVAFENKQRFTSFFQARDKAASMLENWKPNTARRHDFVVPSAYQILHDKGDGGYLGNQFSDTNHLSGTQNCYSQLRELLKTLAQKG